jgi:hypothetical protein
LFDKPSNDSSKDTNRDIKDKYVYINILNILLMVNAIKLDTKIINYKNCILRRSQFGY